MKSFVKTLIVSLGSLFLLNAPAQNFKELRSEHFIIQYADGVDEDFVMRIKEMCETSYREISQEFYLVRDKLWTWDNRARLFIASTKEDYVRKYNCPSWSGACVNYNDKMIYTYPEQKGFNALLVHELTHIIFREYAGKGNFPLWLDEGIATYMENKHGASRSRASRAIKDAIAKDSYIPFDRLGKTSFAALSAANQQYVNLFYMESFSIITFLVDEFGKDKFVQFLYALRQGSSLDNALTQGFRVVKNTKELEEQWKKYYQE